MIVHRCCLLGASNVQIKPMTSSAATDEEIKWFAEQYRQRGEAVPAKLVEELDAITRRRSEPPHP